MEAHIARLSFDVALERRRTGLDCSEQQWFTHERDRAQFESPIEGHVRAVSELESLAICERRFNLLLIPCLRDGDQRILKVGDIPDVGKDESEDLSAFGFGKNRHISDGVAG